MQQDPNFQANRDRFYGAEANENNEFYKNYRAFYASTPQVKHATHMGAHQQDQQKSVVRNRLAENAKRILNTKTFDDGTQVEKVRPQQSEKSQQEHLK